jgi:hypothetical protein
MSSNPTKEQVMSEEIGCIKKNGEKCFCGEPLPWHLQELLLSQITHTCENGHAWKSVADGFSYTGIKKNPFAEYDRAAAAKRS